MKAGVVLGGILVVGGAGLVLYTVLKPSKKTLGRDFDVFTGYKVEDGELTRNTTAQLCKDKCVKDSRCTAVSFDPDTNSCYLVHKDPYESAVSAPQWQLHTRRFWGDLPSTWGPWDPPKCPLCSDKDVTLQRACRGPHCIGEPTQHCDVPGCFDAFDGFRVV